ncbi:RDD family protein [Demequina mangrovi]|uniref:Uncharacterized membrane protein YckC, RDD family n=1 Tax=Demequina mangrovi TaxID=1043493 RepID=A0A1H6X7B1_9MICO|nr:RDD family protein [Demequina mangrovi]SEJ20780.1 Uncharacterized membrane protein YckC, RDD family [Demequina mangrovi]
MTDEDSILIGEGVVLDAGAASVPMRMLSGAIDALATLAVIAATLGLVNSLAEHLDPAMLAAVSVAWVVTCLVIAPVIVETLTRGRSLGRWALGLRIVRDDGGPVGVRHATARALLAVLEIYATFGMLATAVSAFGTRGKRIGDYLAGTYAMRTRGASRALPPLTMPPELAAWARSADIARLPDGLALTSRLFLGRAATMHAPARVRIGTGLAAQLAPRVSPAPPPGTHPEAFMAAVLVERRDREHVIDARRMSRAEGDARRLRQLPYGIPDVD